VYGRRFQRSFRGLLKQTGVEAHFFGFRDQLPEVAINGNLRLLFNHRQQLPSRFSNTEGALEHFDEFHQLHVAWQCIQRQDQPQQQFIIQSFERTNPTVDRGSGMRGFGWRDLTCQLLNAAQENVQSRPSEPTAGVRKHRMFDRDVMPVPVRRLPDRVQDERQCSGDPDWPPESARKRYGYPFPSFDSPWIPSNGPAW